MSPKRKNKTRIGVIGCGRWGRNYLRLFSSLPGSKLVAAADLDKAKLAGIRESYAGVNTFEDYRKLLTKGLCDAVVVATTASSHYRVIKDALAAGLDVLAEKPLALKAEEAENMARIAEDKGRILLVGHVFLFNSSVVRIKEYLKQGVLGDIYYIEAHRTHLGLIREDVNAVWDLAPHDVAMFLYLLEEMPADVQAMGRRVLKADREDAAFINLSFPSGVIGHIHVSWADSNKERLLGIVGSKARIVFDDLNIQEPVRIFYKGISVDSGETTNFGEFKYLLRDGDIVSPMVPFQEPLKVLCEAFLSSIVTRKKPVSDGAFGRDVVKVLCRVEEALK